MQQEPEWRLLCKTAAACWPALEAAIRARHPYERPQIVAFALDRVHVPYADWVEAECIAPGRSP